jgi:lipoyl-dependent peroxiredoxin
MRLILRKAAVRWEGGLKGGNRVLVFERDGVKLPHSGSSDPPSQYSTDPAELIAAAHASSFSLSLVKELGLNGSAPGKIHTGAAVAVEHLEGGWTIVSIHLTVTARLPKLTQLEFIDATVRAKTSCIISRLLRATVSMNAKLEDPRL